ncbi:hypothetical protein BpHYR1_013171 [Brachionus plicatilis]|uniref:Uncharacterized protein n=1 Tax=Brachionus plicatilis TaxID=10195 RepID=A0A3M7T3F0_BRAPC|nr:hypothetical protein BpHYR1_013171 [Brachionus plicatilis]
MELANITIYFNSSSQTRNKENIMNLVFILIKIKITLDEYLFKINNMSNNCYCYYSLKNKKDKLHNLLSYGVQMIPAVLSLLNYGFCQIYLIKLFEKY